MSLQNIIASDQVTPSLFDDHTNLTLDRVSDQLNRRFGRGTVTVASALKTKAYLDHARIPFGKPTELR